jgi:plasmid replication initiation protein
MTEHNLAPLMDDRYPQEDLFICDVADAVMKDIMPQLEHPFYSLSKKPETAIRRYQHGDNWLEVVPSVKGLATIYDKDILIYCISQLMAARNAGHKVSKRIQINSADLLRFTNRGVSGRDYQALQQSLERIRGTTITTNIRTGSHVQIDTFGLIESHSITREFGLDGRLLSCTVTLSDWVFNAIQANEVLTLHRDYFRLRKPLERRLYEIARKHCGQQATWSVSLAVLMKKSGSQSPKKKFRFLVKDLVANDHLPDYRVSFNQATDTVVFTNRSSMPTDRPKLPGGDFPFGRVGTSALQTVSDMHLSIDKYALEQEFYRWVESTAVIPRNLDALFIKYARTRKSMEID